VKESAEEHGLMFWIRKQWVDGLNEKGSILLILL